MKICVLDGEVLTDQKALHDRLAEDLGFPDWYGRNLDALYDCLTDLAGAEVVIRRPEAMEHTFGKYAARFMKVLGRAAEENPGFQVKREGSL